MTHYIASYGAFSVLWGSAGFSVVQSFRNGSARDMGCEWPLDACGCSFAVAYAKRQHERQTVENPAARLEGRALAVWGTEEGQRLFNLGKRKAHAEWLDA